MKSCSCRSHNGFLTAKGLEEAAQRSLEGLEVLAVETPGLYFDRVGSVSALAEAEDLYAFVPEALLNEQYRRFHNGC